LTIAAVLIAMWREKCSMEVPVQALSAKAKSFAAQSPDRNQRSTPGS
jgi:hypothetical protein